MKKKIKKRGSWASYQDPNDKTLFRCDVDELAKKLLPWGKMQRAIGDVKACEISILAEAYLKLRRQTQDEKRENE